MPAEIPRLVRFANGFELLFVPSRTAPVLALELWVRAGSAVESPREAGMAHFVEHMLFKGTQHRAPGAVAREIEAVGGEVNAYTSSDQTVYTVTLASRFADLGLEILEDALFHSAVEPRELESEKKVVIEEIRRSHDLPHHCLSQLLFSGAYHRHPYGKPILGTEASVASFDRGACLEFLGRWYRPGAMTLIAAGNADFRHLEERVRHLFGGRRGPSQPPRHRRPREPRAASFRALFEPRDIEETYFDLAFAGPSATHPDVAALDLLLAVLGQGDASRLQQRVKLDLNLVRGVGTGAYLPADPGLLTVGGVADPALFSRAYEAICEEIFRLRSEPVGLRELERARENLEADFVYQKETVQGQAQKAGFFHVVLGSVDRERDYVEALHRASPESLQVTARRYLRSRSAVLAIVHPVSAPPAWTTDQAARVTAAAEAAAKRRPPPARPRLHKTRTTLMPNGVRLLVKTNPAVPLVALRAAWRGGTRAESPHLAGAFHLLADCLTRGTRSRGVFDIAQEADSLGGQIEGFSGRNSFGLKAEFLSRYLEDGLALFAEVLCHPSFPAEEVAKATEDALGGLRLRKDNPGALVGRLFEQALYRDHPYGRDVLGSAASLSSLRAEHLRSVYEASADPGGLVIAVAGDIDAALVEQFFTRSLEHLSATGTSLPLPAPPAPPDRAILVRHPAEIEQSHVVAGYLGTTITDPQRHALRLVNGVLAGQGGRLFRRLREELGLAYSVSSSCIGGLDRGYIAAYLATAPDRADFAHATLLNEFARLAQEEVSREELEEAKCKLVGGFEIAQQENAFQAAQLCLDELYGLGHGTLESYARDVFAVTTTEVHAAARCFLSETPPVSVILGPPLR